MNHWGYLDTLGAWDEAADMPEQLIRALETARSCVHDSDFAAPTSLRAVVAFAQGTGATACEAAAALTGAQLKVPFTVVRSGSVPAFVDEHTLAFVVSASGETTEVIHGGAGATKGVPGCLAAYPPSEILKILRRKPESCYTSCDDGTPTRSDAMRRWTAKPEGSTQGLSMPNT